MDIFLGWILFSFIGGAIGSNRSIGFWGAFLFCLLLSPLIGIIITLFSKTNEDKSLAEKQTEVLNKISKQTANPTFSTADEIVKLKALMLQGVITQEEFEEQRRKLLNS